MRGSGCEAEMRQAGTIIREGRWTQSGTLAGRYPARKRDYDEGKSSIRETGDDVQPGTRPSRSARTSSPGAVEWRVHGSLTGRSRRQRCLAPFISLDRYAIQATPALPIFYVVGLVLAPGDSGDIRAKARTCLSQDCGIIMGLMWFLGSRREVTIRRDHRK